MRKLVSYLFTTLDGVVDSPDKYWRDDVSEDFGELTALGIAGQDAVLLGRQQYEDWSQFWPTATFEPFATFINTTPKYVASRTLTEVKWAHSALIKDDVLAAVARLKAQPGQAIGVHGSIALTRSLLLSGLVDELRLSVIPMLAGTGRRLLDQNTPVQLDLVGSQRMKKGFQYLVYVPRK